MMQLFKKSIQYLFVDPVKKFGELPLNRKLRKVLLGFLALVVLGIVALMIFVATVAFGFWGNVPNDKELLELKNYQASEIYSADGVLIGRYFVENRSEAKFEEIPTHFIDALIATEDSRFYDHKGVDTRSLFRVLLKSLILGKNKGGGSTLSQQLAKNIFGRKRYGIFTMPVNKIREAIIANKLEKLYSKKEILMLYINTVSFGEDTYGLKTASQRFFSKDPTQLKIEQSSVLVGMLKAPSAFNPRTNPSKSKVRRNVVLGQMVKEGYLEQSLLDSLSKLEIKLKYKKMDANNGFAAHFKEKLKIEVQEILKDKKKPDGSDYNLLTDGLVIKTSLHSKLQNAAEMSILEHLKVMQPALNQQLKSERFFKRHSSLFMTHVKSSEIYKKYKERGMDHKEILDEFGKKEKRSIYSHGGEYDLNCSRLDSIRLAMSVLQSGFLAINPMNGNILAWVGSPNFKYFQYDHVTSKRQVGSIFKPIVYTQAMIDGYKPCDFISNQRITYTQYENWSPQNSDSVYEGRYSLKGALAKSVNTISAKLCMESGIEKVTKLAKTLGIDSELPMKPSVALGTADISLLEMCRMFSTFANGGNLPTLNMIQSISTKSGKTIFLTKRVVQKVLDTEIAQNMTHMLSCVVDFGTAVGLRNKYQFTGKIAAKTGTTQDHKDAWFIGYTPSFLAGVWVGADLPEIHFTSMELGQGSRLAMPIWAKFYQKSAYCNFQKYGSNTLFPDEKMYDCEIYKEDNLLQKLFTRKNKNNHKTGLTKTNDSTQVKKKRKFKFW